MNKMKVKKRNGKLASFDQTKIKISIIKANASVNKIMSDKDMNLLLLAITDEIRSNNKNNVIDVETIEDTVEKSLMKFGLYETAKEFIVYRYNHAKVREIKEIHDDWGVSINAMEILKERYLQDKETPLELLKRVSRFFGKDKKDRDRFYEMFINKRGISASPSLFNAGTDLKVYSPCFCLGFKEDSLIDICNTLEQSIIVESKGGGIGFNISNLREKGSRISTTNGTSSGILSWLKLFDFASSQISQGGRRRGANMAVLNCMPSLNEVHPEILDFITVKMKENISTFNLSILVDDYFMNLIEDDSNDTISLVSPNNKKVIRKVPAQEVFNLAVLGAHTMGDPGMLFYDRIQEDNYYSPNGEDLRTVNPCSEYPGAVGESCDLGSLNLSKYENNDQLSQDTETMTILLNRIIDKNRMPFKDLQKAMLATRKIGIGIMGWGDYCLSHDLVYGSQPSLDELKRLLTVIKKSAISCSERLVEEGIYPEVYSGRCNTNLLSIAPTGTISTFLGCTSGIEPPFGWIYERRILDGSVQIEENRIFKERFPDLDSGIISQIKRYGTIKDIDVFSKREKEVFRIAFEIPPMQHLDIQATAQEICDLSISKTISLPESATIDDVKNIYIQAWKKRCKGITVYRDRSKEDQPISWNFELSCASGKCDL